MHVELEGNLKVHLYGFLFMAIKKYKWFTLDQLNAAIKAHPFGTGRRPPPLPARMLKGLKGTLPSGKGSVPYTSGQMLHLVLHSLEIIRTLPNAAQMHTSPEYAAWAAHVKYFTAMMQPTFTDSTISTLDDLIGDAQRQFLKISAYKPLWKPKNHFAQHIPADIKLFGPPRTYWCMRFEAKNQDHKRAAKMGNFKNTPFTVSEFWAQRSAHRLLLKKRKRSEETTIEKHGLRHQGVDLVRGAWLLVSRNSCPTKLAKVRAVGYDESVGFHLQVTAFDTAVLHTDETGGTSAMMAELDESVGECFVVPLDEGTSLTLLIPIIHSHDRIHFVERP